MYIVSKSLNAQRPPLQIHQHPPQLKGTTCGATASNNSAPQSEGGITKGGAGGVVSDQHTRIAMETLSPEGIARLASSGINVLHVADLHSNCNGYELLIGCGSQVRRGK